MYTASTSGSESKPSYVPWARGMPSSALTTCARPGSRLAMATTSPCVPARTPGIKRWRPMRAVLTTPHLSFGRCIVDPG